MKKGERYKNYSELKGLFTYEVLYKRKGTIFMKLFYAFHKNSGFSLYLQTDNEDIYLIKWVNCSFLPNNP